MRTLEASKAASDSKLGELETQRIELEKRLDAERAARDRAAQESLSRDAHLRSVLAERDTALRSLKTTAAAKDYDRDVSMAQTMERDLTDVVRLEALVGQLESEKLAMAIEHEEVVAREREQADAEMSRLVGAREKAEAELRALVTRLNNESNERKSKFAIERLSIGDGERCVLLFFKIFFLFVQFYFFLPGQTHTFPFLTVLYTHQRPGRPRCGCPVARADERQQHQQQWQWQWRLGQWRHRRR
jgi:hypothetical protein